MKNRSSSRRLIAFLAACVIGTWSVSGLADEGRHVSVTMERSIHFMGSSLPAVFRFHSDTSIGWELDEPGRSPHCGWQAEAAAIKNHPGGGAGRSLGSYETKTIRLPDGVVIESFAVKAAPKIKIPAGKSYEVRHNLHEPYPKFDHAFHPGHWTLKMTYWDAATRTNHESKPFKFDIGLTEEFIDWCLATYRNRKADGSDRQWAGEYLHKMREDLEFGEADETIPARLRNPWNERVAKDEVTFVLWWKKNRDAEEGRKAIDLINESYGLDPAKVRKEYQRQKAKPPTKQK